MTALLLTDARVTTPQGVLDPGWLLVEGAAIAAIGHGSPADAPTADLGDVEVIDARGAWLLPGFIDVHVHGALGRETMDADPGGLAEMAGFYAAHGVTSFLATTWTGTHDETLAALHTVADTVRGPAPSGAQVLGAHMEGPYLNASRCGAQDASLIRPADLEEAAAYLGTGVVRLMTIAPEVPGNLAFIEECVRRGVVASAGHTDATYDQMVAAVDAGVRHVTHTFNTMRALHHREPGVVGAAMTMPSLSVELIADGIHVHPAAMRALYAARGPDAIVLITDAIRATGMPPGEYAIGDRTVTLVDGAVRLPDGALAGSVLTLDVALRNLQRATGASLAELWPTTSRNAAHVIGVDDRKGSIEVGRDADLVLVDDDVRVSTVVVEGRIVHRDRDQPDATRRDARAG